MMTLTKKAIDKAAAKIVAADKLSADHCSKCGDTLFSDVETEVCTDCANQVETEYGDTVTPIKLKDVKKGDFLRRNLKTLKTYTRGDYDRTYKKYRCDDWGDISRDILLKGNTVVYIGFDF